MQHPAATRTPPCSVSLVAAVGDEEDEALALAAAVRARFGAIARACLGRQRANVRLRCWLGF